MEEEVKALKHLWFPPLQAGRQSIRFPFSVLRCPWPPGANLAAATDAGKKASATCFSM